MNCRKKAFSIILVGVALMAMAALPAFATGEKEATVPKQAKKESIKIGVSLANNSFDPHYSYGSDCNGSFQVYDTLVEMKGTNVIVPNLAERWETSTDGKVYTFYLKKGVKFHDGTILKASDVVFSLQRAFKSPFVGSAFPKVEKTEALDEYTVRCTLVAPYAPFMNSVSYIFAGIVSEAAVTKYGEAYGKSLETVTGTGPYRLAEWKPGELVRLEAFESYHREKAAIKTMIFQTIPESSTAVIALETGEIDLYDNIPAVSVSSLKAKQNLTIYEYPSLTYFFVMMNNSTGPFSKLPVRQAVAHIVERGKYLTLGKEGMGQIINSPISPNWVGYPGDLGWYPVDITKAKSLLAQAGYPEGFSVKIKSQSNDPFPKLAAALQEDLGKIGIKSEIVLMEKSAFRNDVYKLGSYDITVASFGSIVEDADMLNVELNSANVGSGGNWSRYANPDMDKLLAQARAEQNATKRIAFYKQIVDKFKAEVIHIPLFYGNQIVGFDKNLKFEDKAIELEYKYRLHW